MRLNHLDLARYGRFTARRIELPVSQQDIHIILGPNEAGKSTLRSAISDLLYGIPPKTRLAFLHAMPDMRLGAGLQAGRGQGEGTVLEIQRVKGNKQTLRDNADKPLADNTLAPFIGSTDREFFGQMFSLDHDRMVKGGRSILSASDNLGQILFQSAAGIASLGSVRDDLQAQADRLWSPRRSRDRQYYVAADELESATAALKLATVRTKDWVEAHGALTAATQSHDQLRQQLVEVRQQRARLERIRRVLPPLQALKALEEQRDSMGKVVELPESAAQTLQDTERAMGIEAVAIAHQQAQLQTIQDTLAGITTDTAVLDAAAEIAELDEKRLQYRAYAADIPRRQAECDAHWAVAHSMASQLGWPAMEEQAVLARLPAAPVRTALARLARDNTALHLAVETTSRAVRQKQIELDQAESALAALPPAQTPADLQAALQRAKRLGDAGVALQRAQQTLDLCATALESSLAELGPWRAEVPTLRAMTPPSAEAIQTMGQDARQDTAQAQALAARITRLRQQAGQAALEARQYQASHDTVSRDELDEARRQRDQTWRTVKDSPEALRLRSAEFELQLATADALADRRHDTVQEASALQARMAQLERAQLELRLAEDEQAQLTTHIELREKQWSALAAACGLAGLPFEAAPAWLTTRTRALEAAATADHAQAEAHGLHNTVASICSDLARAMEQGRDTGQAVTTLDADGFDRLVLEAERRVQTANTVMGRRQSLEQQRLDAQAAMRTLQDERQVAEQALAQWSTQWAAGLAAAGIAVGTHPAAVEAQLAQLEEMSQALAGMRKIRVDRIDKMLADLDRHEAVAKALARRLMSALETQAADVIALALSERLAAAREAQQHAQRLAAEAAAAERHLLDATLRRDQAHACLAPLLQRAGAQSTEALADAISLSDRWRAVQSAVSDAARAAREGGDGLAIDQLQAEATAIDPALLVSELGNLAAREDELVSALSNAAAQRQAAGSTLQAIAGTADAAQAESRRQQALASMTDAVERYVKVFTAARLLGWSIEQYREAKQGPMLRVASTIFANLTQGSFDRLVVDFEHDPPKLQGRRPNGGVVDIDGMSEGTQDQLFLALRLAALDMHLDHAPALPFIADDLFVNYDDDRARAGLFALGELSGKTQVLFLTHHAHMLPLARQVFGDRVNIVQL